jgi:hypothetical protein
MAGVSGSGRKQAVWKMGYFNGRIFRMAFKVLHSDMDLVLNAHAMDRQDAQVAVVFPVNHAFCCHSCL